MISENPSVGSRVRVVRPISETERNLIRLDPEEIYTLINYTRTHGYAVIRDTAEGCRWLVHPEALETVTEDTEDTDDRGHQPHCPACGCDLHGGQCPEGCRVTEDA